MFTAPLWLLGLAALAIPLLLHLWSRKPRQVIRVGTLRHVDLTADARSWSARLTDPLLLALRLALLITIVFALAGLRLPARRSAGTGSTLVLVDPALLAPETAFPFLDSIARERETVRLLTRGLPKLQLDGSAAWRLGGSARSPEPSAGARPTDLWGALTEGDALVGSRGTIHVVARPRLTALSGPRPQLRAKIEWHAPPTGAAAQWMPIAWHANDTMYTVLASGSATGTLYTFGRTLRASCPHCATLAPRRLLIQAGDSVAEQRIGIAIEAVASAIALPITRTGALDSADAIVSDQPLDDSLLARGVTPILLTPAAVASAAIADSLWARWPWRIVPRDGHDPRQVSLAQALPSIPASALPALGDPEATRRGLILLALLLFVIERWLATRPGRSEA